MVARIATGEGKETLPKIYGRVSTGWAGAKARVEKLTGGERSVIAKKAAAGRWG